MAPESEENTFTLLFRQTDPLLEDFPEEYGLRDEENRFESLVQKIFFPLQDHLEENE